MKNFINTFKRLAAMTILMVTFFIFLFLLFFRLDIMTDLLTSKVGIGITVGVVCAGIGFLVGYLKCYLDNSKAYDDLFLKYTYCKKDLHDAKNLAQCLQNELNRHLTFNRNSNSIMAVLKAIDFRDDKTAFEEEETTNLQEEMSDDES